MQMGSRCPGYKNAFRALCSIAKYEGFRGLYAGYKPCVVLDCSFSALQFAFYEFSRDFLHRRRTLMNMNSIPRQDPSLPPVPVRYDSVTSSLFDGSLWTDSLCGAFSGGLAALLTNPIDVVTNRMMLQNFMQQHFGTSSGSYSSGGLYYRSTFDCFRRVSYNDYMKSCC